MDEPEKEGKIGQECHPHFPLEHTNVSNDSYKRFDKQSSVMLPYDPSVEAAVHTATTIRTAPKTESDQNIFSTYPLEFNRAEEQRSFYLDTTKVPVTQHKLIGFPSTSTQYPATEQEATSIWTSYMDAQLGGLNPTSILVVSWKSIVEAFIEEFHETASISSGKIHLDISGISVDGARDKWMIILLLDCLMAFMLNKDRHKQECGRRRFNQYNALATSVCKICAAAWIKLQPAPILGRRMSSADVDSDTHAAHKRQRMDDASDSMSKELITTLPQATSSININIGSGSDAASHLNEDANNATAPSSPDLDRSVTQSLEAMMPMPLRVRVTEIEDPWFSLTALRQQILNGVNSTYLKRRHVVSVLIDNFPHRPSPTTTLEMIDSVVNRIYGQHFLVSNVGRNSEYPPYRHPQVLNLTSACLPGIRSFVDVAMGIVDSVASLSDIIPNNTPPLDAIGKK